MWVSRNSLARTIMDGRIHAPSSLKVKLASSTLLGRIAAAVRRKDNVETTPGSV